MSQKKPSHVWWHRKEMSKHGMVFIGTPCTSGFHLILMILHHCQIPESRNPLRKYQCLETTNPYCGSPWPCLSKPDKSKLSQNYIFSILEGQKTRFWSIYIMVTYVGIKGWSYLLSTYKTYRTTKFWNFQVQNSKHILQSLHLSIEHIKVINK